MFTLRCDLGQRSEWFIIFNSYVFQRVCTSFWSLRLKWEHFCNQHSFLILKSDPQTQKQRLNNPRFWKIHQISWCKTGFGDDFSRGLSASKFETWISSEKTKELGRWRSELKSVAQRTFSPPPPENYAFQNFKPQREKSHRDPSPTSPANIPGVFLRLDSFDVQ